MEEPDIIQWPQLSRRPRPCPTFDFFNEEAIGGPVQGDAAGDSFRASAVSCASANRSNRTAAAGISYLLQLGASLVRVASAHNPAARQQIGTASRRV